MDVDTGEWQNGIPRVRPRFYKLWLHSFMNFNMHDYFKNNKFQSLTEGHQNLHGVNMPRGTGSQFHSQICLDDVNSTKGPGEGHCSAYGHFSVPAPPSNGRPWNPYQKSIAYTTGLSRMFPGSIFLSLCQYYNVLSIHTSPPNLLCFFGVISVILDLLNFQSNFRISLSVSPKKKKTTAMTASGIRAWISLKPHGSVRVELTP